MGRVAIRQAIIDYLAPAVSHIDSLGAVFPFPPRVTSEGDLFAEQAAGAESGSAIFVFIHTQSERRLGIGPPATIGRQTPAQKIRTYAVDLLCITRSHSDDVASAGNDHDAFLDALVAYIEANRTIAAEDTLTIQWGEGDMAGAQDIKITTNLPKAFRLQKAFQQWSVIEVTVLELVNT